MSSASWPKFSFCILFLLITNFIKADFCQNQELTNFCSKYIANQQNFFVYRKKDMTNPFKATNVYFNKKFCAYLIKYRNYYLEICININKKRLFVRSDKKSDFQIHYLAFFISIHDVILKNNIQLSSLFSKLNIIFGRTKTLLNDMFISYKNDSDKDKKFTKFITFFAKEYFYNDTNLLEMNKEDISNQHKQNNKKIKSQVNSSESFLFDKRNRKHYRKYMSNFKCVFYNSPFSVHIVKFLELCCRIVFESKEFAPAKKILPGLNLISKLSKNNIISLNNFFTLHEFLTCILIKTRFINFVLFGEFNKLFKVSFIPKYKLKIINGLKMDMINMFKSYLKNLSSRDFDYIKKSFEEGL